MREAARRTVCSLAGPGGIPAAVRPALAALAAGAILAGCGRPARVPDAVAPSAGPRRAAARLPEVRLVDHEGLMREVERHRGRVVVLDCWSTSCPPCVEEFPGLVRLAAAQGDRVVCLSLCFDYDGIGKPEDCVPLVREFLGQVGAAGIVNMLSSEEADSLYRKLELASVPAVYVWKPDGTLAIRYDDASADALGRPYGYADVARTVAGLLPPAGRGEPAGRAD